MTRPGMKALLVLSCLMLLASCLKVENFGDYWDKGTIDPYLVGNWELARDPSKGKMTVTLKDGAYNFAFSTREKFMAKILKGGKYHFLMLKQVKQKDDGNGYLVRYKIDDGRVVLYEFDKTALAEFLKTRYSDTQVFDRKSEGDGITIKLLNDETLNILSDIPDTPQYWHISDEYSPI